MTVTRGYVCDVDQMCQSFHLECVFFLFPCPTSVAMIFDLIIVDSVLFFPVGDKFF